MFSQTANLVLKHADISTDTTLLEANNNGSYWTNGKQKTLFQVNLKRVLGTLWDDYDEFVLRLNQFSNAFATYAVTIGSDTQWIVNISGLNFKNATYNVSSKNLTTRYQAQMVYVPNNSAQTLTYPPNVSVCNFYKNPNSEIVELTFELLRMVDNTPIQSGNTERIPHCCWVFDIIPVGKKK